MKAKFAEPEQFIRDLGKVSATLVSPAVVEEFLCDLDKVHRQILAGQKLSRPVSVDTFDQLAGVFKGTRLGALKRIGGKDFLEKLPANDPLRCPVSLFGSLDLGLRETAHTRALAWLMDPREEHGFRMTLLRVFLKVVFNLDNDFRIETADVRSETSGNESRDRIDIHMSGKWTLSGRKPESWLVLVEAKIEANESEDQCAKYENQFRRAITSADRSALVFLTHDGRQSISSSKNGPSKWCPLSFINLAGLFWQESPALLGKPGLEFLRLYVTGVLKDLYELKCGQISDQDDIYRVGDFLLPQSPGGKNHE